MENSDKKYETKTYYSNKNIQRFQEDAIVNMKPQAIKMDILLFKNDILKEVKIIEKGIIEKSKEINTILKDKMTLFDDKMGFINDQVLSLSHKIIDGVKMREELNTLNCAREKLFDESTSNRIKINMLEKESRESINRIDEILKMSVIYPSIIGIKGKFRNFHEFIDFLLAESNTNNNFRQKNIMDLSSYKLKIEKSLQTLGFKIENILSSCNAFTSRNIKEIKDRFDYNLEQYKDKLNELRIENSNYVIQLEKDTKDLRNETNIVKSMKSDIFAKVDNDVNVIKKENANIIDTFKIYKNDFEKMNQNIKTIENKIDDLLTQRIGLLFDEQQKIWESLENFKKEHNEFINDKIYDKIRNIVNEQIHNVIGDINIKQLALKINNHLNSCDNNTLNNNNINPNINNYNINNNLNNLNNYNKNNINSNMINNKDRNNNHNNNNFSGNSNNNNNNINNRRSNIMSKRNSVSNIYAKNIIKQNNNSLININQRNNNLSPKRHSIDFKTNTPYNSNKHNSNYNINFHGDSTNNNNNQKNNHNIIMNKKILETLNNNNKGILNYINNDISENILSEIKNDNIITAKKSNFHIVLPQKKKSFNSYSNQEEINNNNISNRNFNEHKQNINKFSIVSRNKKSSKFKFKIKSEEDNEYDNFIKMFNKNKNSKRRSFDLSNNEDLDKFQKLLKININDVDAKLNYVNSVSSSFEILNENKEIYDRFIDSKIIKKDNKDNLHNNRNKRDQITGNTNEYNKIDVISLDKNNNEDDLNIKNIILAKTSSDFYTIESNKKNKYDLSLNPIKNKNIYKTSKKINSNLIKKTNSELLNLKNDMQKKVQSGFQQNDKTIIPMSNGDQIHKQSEESPNKYHNYFIGFQQEDNKKIKKEKNKNKSNNKHFQMMINEDIKMNKNRFIKNK